MAAGGACLGGRAGAAVWRGPPLGCDLTDNVAMLDLDPESVIEAVARDPRLRAFIGHGRIETLPARQSRRRLLLDKIAPAFEPGVRYPERCSYAWQGLGSGSTWRCAAGMTG